MFKGRLVALITPFTAEEAIDFDLVAQLIEWHIEQGTNGIIVAGTTGESATLSDEEIVTLATFSAKQSNGRIAIIAGNGTNSTMHSVELTKALNDSGIDGLLTVTPYYNKPTDEGLYWHYRAINDASRLPILLYNVPSRTACDMSIELVARLSELKHIIGIKDATGDLARVAKYRAQCEKSFVLLSGDDETAVEFCKLGGDGVISVTANVAPNQMAQVHQLLKEEKYQQAQTIENTLASLHKDLFVESNPIPVKWALMYMAKIPNANMRKPLTVLSSEGQIVIGRAINDLPRSFQEN